MRNLSCLLGLVVCLGCGGAQEELEAPPVKQQPAQEQAAEAPAMEYGPLADEAVAGVDDQEVAALLRDHWEWQMRRAPVWATTLGDHRFDRELSADGHEAVLDARARTRLFLSDARKLANKQLGRRDRITLQLFIEELEANVASEVCDFHLWSVSTFDNPVSEFNTLPERHRIGSFQDAQNLLARYRKIPGSIGDAIDNLRLGLGQGLVAGHETVRRTIELLDRQLEKPIEKWALMKPARDAEGYEGWTRSQRRSFSGDLKEVVSGSIKPAIARYRRVLADEVLPKARGPEQAGLGGLKSGAACYQARIRAHTGLDRTARELHELGLREIERIDGEMKKLGKKLFGTSRFARITEHLRTDRSLYFENREQILKAANAALAAAKAKVPDWFGIQPKTDCVVAEIPDYEAPFSTIAYYQPPHFDGSKPGEYFVNTYKPEVRPRYEMQVLAFHESIPGHHLQIAISQEQGELPAFRRFGGNTAFVEGWALYTERLADEMGLYSGDLDRMGMLSYDAWRAARLVVDTGLHAMGWTRERAEKFMKEHTALTEDNISNEVDRYLAWPGQALAYKVGQLEILALRARARKELGDRFDIKAFHDAVLRHGAVTLPVLREEIERWISETKRER